MKRINFSQKEYDYISDRLKEEIFKILPNDSSTQELRSNIADRWPRNKMVVLIDKIVTDLGQ